MGRGSAAGWTAWRWPSNSQPAVSAPSACGRPPTLLDDRLRLLWQGRRTALPRHQTLSATLDWSFDLLSERERVILRRLSVFVGAFGLEAAQQVVADGVSDQAEIVEIIAGLLDKSLAVADAGDTAVRYRLLDTTRTYARQKLLESGEYHEIQRKHAAFYAAFVDRLTATAGWLSKIERVRPFSEHLGNVRAALEYSFSPHGEVAVAVELASASALSSSTCRCSMKAERGASAGCPRSTRSPAARPTNSSCRPRWRCR